MRRLQAGAEMNVADHPDDVEPIPKIETGPVTQDPVPVRPISTSGQGNWPSRPKGHDGATPSPSPRQPVILLNRSSEAPSTPPSPRASTPPGCALAIWSRAESAPIPTVSPL